MNNIIVIGDIHAHSTWKNIVEKHKRDTIIFLGDYFDCFSNKDPKLQCANMESILDLKEKRGDKCILLLGNHDYHYLQSTQHYSGYNPMLQKEINESGLRERLITTLVVAHYDKTSNTIFSHAGISQYWLKLVSGTQLNTQQAVEKVCTMFVKDGSLMWNHIEGYSWIGDSVSQSPIWIRPNSLISSWLPGYNQVVGHTPDETIRGTEVRKGEWLYVCDAMPREYIMYDSELGEFKVMKLNI